MKQIYFVLISIFTFGTVTSQAIIPYVQQQASYESLFGDGGGNYNSGANEFGMWANFSAKQSVAWKNFTEDGTTAGTPYILGIGDSFTITVYATRAYGQIGIALLSNPSSTSSWTDRYNNVSVQVDMNGMSGGSWDPWEVVNFDGTTVSAVFGDEKTYADTKLTFELKSATEMDVYINDVLYVTDGTLKLQNITGYSIYLEDDYSGDNNYDIFWKQTSELSSIILGTEDYLESSVQIFSSEDHIHIKGLNSNKNYNLSLFDTMGRQVKNIRSNSDVVDISELHSAVYFLTLETEEGSITRKKIII